MSFHRTRTQPRGGPDGGDGGKGGDVLFKATIHVKDFEHLKKTRSLKAEDGRVGGSQLKKGAVGKDLIVRVPVGTVLRDEKNRVLRDFSQSLEDVFLEGGRGGHGNHFFKNSKDQAPRKFQKGEKGKLKKVTLEYKPLIDVAIIGKVNAGKSSFFNLVTRRKSPVASYPYTTLIPYEGEIKENKGSFLLDIPGLEKAASLSEKKGLCFLRACQRSKILLHFLNSESETVKEDREELEQELKNFDKKHYDNYFEKLSKKPMFYVFSKSDSLMKKKEKILQKN